MNSQILGNQIIKLVTVDSTNNYVAKLVNKTKISFGTVIMADFQTKGRGQRDNLWYSDKGKTYFLVFILILLSLQLIRFFI